jgi:hypothetical protein
MQIETALNGDGVEYIDPVVRKRLLKQKTKAGQDGFLGLECKD